MNGKTIGFMVSYLIATMLLIIPGQSNASAEVEIIKYEPGSQVDTLSYILHSWDENSSIPLDPIYCPADSGCSVGIAWQVGDPGSGYIAPPSLAGYETMGAKTIGDLERLWRAKFGYGAVVTKNGTRIGAGSQPICFGMKYSSARGGGVKVVPGSGCTTVDPGPPVNACYLEGPINLEHGEVAGNNIDDSQVSKLVNIRCLQDAIVNVDVTSDNSNGDVRLRSDGSLLSRLYVNEKQGANVVSVPGGTMGVNIEFKSKLISNGEVSSGVFSGSAIAVVSFL